MLRLKCRNCNVVLLEAEERWAKVALTGMCPECSWFYDEAKEMEAERLADDPKIVSGARRTKIHDLALGAAAIAGALLGIGFFFLAAQATGSLYIFIIAAFVALLIFGLRTLLHGILYDPRRQARSRVARRTDLRALAEQQEAAGVFLDRHS